MYQSTDVARLLGEMSLVIGDAIHNLRASLDHAWLVVAQRIDPAIVGKYTRFPIAETRQDLEAKLKGKNIHISAPGVFDVITAQIKSYGGGNDTLWTLHDLDIIDKHQLLLPVVAHGALDSVTVEDQSGRLHEIRSDAIPVGDIIYFDFAPGCHVKDHGDLSVGVVLGQVGAVKDMEISSVLALFVNEVEKSLRILGTCF